MVLWRGSATSHCICSKLHFSGDTTWVAWWESCIVLIVQWGVRLLDCIKRVYPHSSRHLCVLLRGWIYTGIDFGYMGLLWCIRRFYCSFFSIRWATCTRTVACSSICIFSMVERWHRCWYFLIISRGKCCSLIHIEIELNLIWTLDDLGHLS